MLSPSALDLLGGGVIYLEHRRIGTVLQTKGTAIQAHRLPPNDKFRKTADADLYTA